MSYKNNNRFKKKYNNIKIRFKGWRNKQKKVNKSKKKDIYLRNQMNKNKYYYL